MADKDAKNVVDNENMTTLMQGIADAIESNSITDVGTLPSMSVSGEVLTFSPGTLPRKGN